MSDHELIDIVDDNDNIIGKDKRKVVHDSGKCHRGIIVLIYTSRSGVILQKRGAHKEMAPGRYSFSVGGHVESGDSYIETAIRELKEESGIEATPENLVKLGKAHVVDTDPETKFTHNIFHMWYAYHFDGAADKLVVEKDEADGFREFPLDDILMKADYVKEVVSHLIFKEDEQKFLAMLKPLIEKTQ